MTDSFQKRLTRLSATQLNMYLRCPQQWYLRYVKGIKIPPAGNMMQGRIYHLATADNFKQKIETGKDLEFDVLEDMFSEHWKKAIDDTDVNWEGEKPATLKDEGRLLLKCYHTEVAPRVHPKSVEEQKVKNVIPGILDAVGITDVIDNNNKILDHKLSAREKSQSDADRDLQATMYLWLRPECKTFIFHQVIKKRPTKNMLVRDPESPSILPYKNLVSTKRTAQQVDRFVLMIADTYKLMQTGVFPPRCDSFWCSEKWCGYWNICKARFSTH